MPDPTTGTEQTAAREARDTATAAREARDSATAPRGARDTATVARPASAPGGYRAAFAAGYTVRGRYLLEKLIGQGAMGQVWRARDLLAEEARDRDPHVALKVLNADFEARPDAFVALHREAARAQKLAHPNVVTVHVFDRDERSGHVFIVMELLEGRALDEIIRTAGTGGLPRERALPILRGMAEGLAYAHRRGIVHSDFKPANVFVTPDGTPKILDFGIARAVQVAGAEDTDDGGFEGLTPAYAAPEALAGSAPTTAEDVFSLGVVAFELVTGRHPFDWHSALEARDAHIARPPLRGLKHRESRAIDKALAYDRRERFPDGAAFLRGLQGVPVIQKALVVAVAVLTLAAAGLWLRNYLASLPEPLEQLPADIQQQVHEQNGVGEQALAYLRRTHDIVGSEDAAKSFAEAYRLHPRDREATRGLDTAADYAIEWFGKFPDRRAALQQLRNFRDIYPDYYQNYGPMQRAIRAAGGE